MFPSTNWKGTPEFLNPEQEAYSTLVQELYDEEFDEALFELMVEARGLHEEHMVSSAQSVEGERLLNQHFNQLIREAEATVTAFEREFGARDVTTLGEGELDAFAERYSPTTTLSPEFEDFLGKWAKKLAKGVKGLAKKAGKFAMKIGLGPILNKIKALVKPLLDKVLQTAIGKLPESLRPAAQQLAERISGRRREDANDSAASDARRSGLAAAPSTRRGAPADAGSAVQAPAGAGVTEIQQEFDQQLATPVHGLRRSGPGARSRASAQRRAAAGRPGVLGPRSGARALHQRAAASSRKEKIRLLTFRIFCPRCYPRCVWASGWSAAAGWWASCRTSWQK